MLQARAVLDSGPHIPSILKKLDRSQSVAVRQKLDPSRSKLHNYGDPLQQAPQVSARIS